MKHRGYQVPRTVWARWGWGYGPGPRRDDTDDYRLVRESEERWALIDTRMRRVALRRMAAENQRVIEGFLS